MITVTVTANALMNVRILKIDRYLQMHLWVTKIWWLAFMNHSVVLQLLIPQIDSAVMHDALLSSSQCCCLTVLTF